MSRLHPVRHTLVAATLGAVALTGCGDGSAPPPTAPELIAAFQAAYDVTAHSGTRRYEAHFEQDGVRYDQEYTEKVWFDDQGNYRIDPDQVHSNLTMPPQAFLLLQAGRAGWVKRYRDFRVHDLQLFGSNYWIQDLGGIVTYLGRSAWRAEVKRNPSAGGANAAHVFEVVVDLETGIVLEYSERDENGELLTRMAYETIDFAPDLSGVAWHTPSNQEQPIDVYGDLVGQVGFETLIPKQFPAGYAFREASTVTDPTGRTWVKTTFADGLEHVFFLQGAPTPPDPFMAAQMGEEGMPDDHVYSWKAGRVAVLQGNVGGFDVMAVGKVSEDELLTLIDSALP